MATGYDHILFLLGVIFFLYRMKHIALYVTLFAIGHSTTMLLGVYFNVGINSYIIDAIIGLSVVYKALDNIGAFQRWLGFQPNTKVATVVFGLFHGFGLSTKIIEYNISPDGLIPNLLAFNVGVEIGQLLALGSILIAMSYWRRTASFWRHAYTANVAMMCAGFILIGYQLTGYFCFLNRTRRKYLCTTYPSQPSTIFLHRNNCCARRLLHSSLPSQFWSPSSFPPSMRSIQQELAAYSA